MTNHKEPFIFKIVPWFIGFVFLTILGYFVGLGLILGFSFQEIRKVDFSRGVKPVIEKIWCGYEGCLDKERKNE